MNINDVDLKLLRAPLEDTLSIYCARLGIYPHSFYDFTLTPEKPNYARTVVPLSSKSASIGNMFVIAFLNGNGTGDAGTYSINDIIIPEDFSYENNKEKLLPRAKTKIIKEGFFPFFSIAPDGHLAVFASALDELSIVDNTLKPIARLGLNDAQYASALKGHSAALPKVYCTVGEEIDGTRFGDPHSIHYNKRTPEALQVAGFLSITDEKNPLLIKSREWFLPSMYK